MKRLKMMCFLLALLGLLSACSAHSVDAEEQSAPTWQSRYDLGVRYLSDGRYEEAILAFTAAIEIDPKNAQAYEQRGDAYWELAQSAQGSEQTDAYRSAAEDYESAMQWGSETDELYRRAADAYYGAQDYEKAESYYEKLLEKDEDVLARLIECSRALGTGKELAKRLQARYLETGEERYLQALCELWPQEALRAYAALLGTDGTMGFALVDLDEDGTPELICGEIDTKGQSEQIALTDYTLYTWKNDQVMELYHGFVDTWINPDVRVTTAGAIVNEGHGTSAGYELQYVRWDGVQIEHHDFWSYAKSEDLAGDRAYYLDDVEVSEAVFYERLADCTEGDDGYVLRFLANTPENCRKYLRDSIQASRQPEQPQLNEQELLALLQENLAWLNAVEGETFFVEGQGSYMAIVSYENGQYGRIKRLVPSPATTSELESTLAEDEAIDPTFSSYYPISNYSSEEQILDNLREYMDVDSLGIMQSPYATVSDTLDENVMEFNGGLYLVRGGRGYGVYDYDPQTLRIVSSDETACEAECDLLCFEQFDSVQTISFEKRNGRWIIVHVGKAGSSADPYTITAETRADRSLYPRPERTLERGSQGEDVKYVQAMLVVMNYDGVVVDGDFGPATEAALMRWQKNHSLTQTGVVDADTLQQLEAAETEWLLRE